MKFFLIAFCLAFSACDQKPNLDVRQESEENNKNVLNEAQESVSTGSIFLVKYNNKVYRDSLALEARKGSKLAFNELKDLYFYTEHDTDFLFISLEISDKYSYPEAYLTNHSILSRSNSTNIKNLGFYYLLKASEANSDAAKEILRTAYKGRPITPSTQYWEQNITINK